MSFIGIILQIYFWKIFTLTIKHLIFFFFCSFHKEKAFAWKNSGFYLIWSQLQVQHSTSSSKSYFLVILAFTAYCHNLASFRSSRIVWQWGPYNTCLHASWTRWPCGNSPTAYMDSRGSLNLLWNEPAYFYFEVGKIFLRKNK